MCSESQDTVLPHNIVLRFLQKTNDDVTPRVACNRDDLAEATLPKVLPVASCRGTYK